MELYIMVFVTIESIHIHDSRGYAITLRDHSTCLNKGEKAI